MQKMVRLEDKGKNVVWINKDNIVTVQEERASPGSVVTLVNNIQVHTSETPDDLMRKFIGAF